MDQGSDGDDLRQSRTSGGAIRQLLWNTNGALPLLLDDGDETYLYGPTATPIAQINRTGTTSYLQADLVGTPRLLTSATGAVVASMADTAYGTTAGRTGTASTNIGYTGNWTDPDTGLVYLRARDYDPATGQFLTVDPAVNSTRQPYAYTANSPLGTADPTGLCGSTPTPQIQCATPSLIDQALTSAPAEWLTRVLTTGPTGAVSNFLQGIGNGATFGLTGDLRRALTPAYACTADQSALYAVGTAAGAAGSLAVGVGEAGTAIRAASEAVSAERALAASNDARIGLGPVAQDVTSTFDRIAAGKPTGYKGGQPFDNDGRMGTAILPRTTDSGDAITYQEWDVAPRGLEGRGDRRLVTGKDGSAYYSPDHYDSYIRFH